MIVTVVAARERIRMKPSKATAKTIIANTTGLIRGRLASFTLVEAIRFLDRGGMDFFVERLGIVLLTLSAVYSLPLMLANRT